ncbi:chloride channel protein [Trypanosoma theileri]|uniref:Chloride channel protein n=1 Tax=Trypanosoma theileri TaxID=67003 RepID=A0A1X0NKT6_9TRYP|nr:chloride channel protein [Trypanosoma theileri]ORC85384.1 chloride channel protein [Trypanosoma theileri]
MMRQLLREFWETANPYTQYLEEMTPEEKEKQESFESFDYYKPYPSMYMKHLRQHYAEHSVESTVVAEQPAQEVLAEVENGLPHYFEGARMNVLDAVKNYDADERNEALRWFLHVLIAIFVGIVAMVISFAVEYMEEYRAEKLDAMITKHHVMGRFMGFFFFIGVSLALVAIATLVVVLFEPAASGGGIPDVIAYLNGVQMRKAMNVRTFFAKGISCMCAVAGGLPVGLEAPLIHLGAITGAGVTQGRSRTLGCQTKLFHAFRNNKDRRDFITAGAACGVSAAFGAPIGGLLFVMEEVSSFWDHSASGQIFLATMICFTTISMFRSLMEDQRLLGWVSNAVSVLFEVNLTIPLNLLSIVPSFFLGILCGALAAVFTKVNLMLVKYRRKYLRPFLLRRFLEPLVIVAIYGTLSYILALVPDCRPKYGMDSSNDTLVWGTENRTRLFTATCLNNESYAPLATLTMGTGKDTIRHLFSRQTIGEFPAGYIFLFLILYTLFACWSNGTSVSGGLVVPSLVIGAAFGRLYGQFLWFLTVRGAGAERSYWASQAWLDPGVFALIGAGAFLSGTSRMTMSICVIMVELSSELHYLLPVMVAIVMSKTVADLISEPLYHQMLRLDSVPYLQAHLLRPEFEQLTAADVMASDVVTLRLREKTSVVMEALRQTAHHAFPVVEAVDERKTQSDGILHTGNCGEGGVGVGEDGQDRVRYKFVGLVTREDVQIYLTLPTLYSTNTQSTVPSSQTDGLGGNLSPGVLATNKMTWTEWLTHKTSLFFVLGDRRWSELWARSNHSEGHTGGVDHNNTSLHSISSRIDNDNLFLLDESRLPPVLDFSLIVNRSPWVIPPFFNLQMAYHTFRMMGLRHMVVVDGDAVVGIITRKDLLVDTLRRRVRELHPVSDDNFDDMNPPSLMPSLSHSYRSNGHALRPWGERLRDSPSTQPVLPQQVMVPDLFTVDFPEVNPVVPH